MADRSVIDRQRQLAELNASRREVVRLRLVIASQATLIIQQAAEIDRLKRQE